MHYTLYNFNISIVKSNFYFYLINYYLFYHLTHRKQKGDSSNDKSPLITVVNFFGSFIFSMATSYPRRGRPPTTLGAKKLNFCVRHGNRCILLAIATTLFFWIITLQPLKCRLQESNLWPSVYDTDALPTELSRRKWPVRDLNPCYRRERAVS